MFFDRLAVLLAGGLATIGLAAVSAITRLRGYRLGGTITVGLLAIYSLFSPAALLLFLPSTALAYGALRVLRERTLIYGRDEFVAALATGALPSFAVLAVDAAFPGTVPSNVATSFFLGSILPGLAAYNVVRTDPEYRRRDAAWATALYVGLVAFGVVVAAPAAAFVGDRVPVVLLGGDAALAALHDEAVAAGATVAPAARQTVIGVLVLAFLLSEAVRRRLGLRLGIVSLGLIAIYTLLHRWYLPLFVLETAVAFAGIQLVHRRRFVYGRALLSLSCGVGVAVGTVAATIAPLRGGLAGLMVGVLAGVMAYNVHVTPPAERRQLVPIAVAAYTVLLLVARGVAAPSAAGAPQDLGVLQGLAATVVLAGSLWLVAREHVATRDGIEIVANSVLFGGDG